MADDRKDTTPPPRRTRSSIERRAFLKIMGGSVGGAAAVGAGLVPFSAAPMQHKMVRGMKHKAHLWTSQGGGLAKFVDALPIPRTASPIGLLNGVPLYEITMRPLSQKLHRDLPPTPLWGYDGLYSGPTFETRRGRPIAVRWRNALPATHLFTIAPLHGTEAPTPDVRTVVHVHGIKVLPESDGYPEAWFTNGFRTTGPFFRSTVYHYPNDQPATGLWYHDHSLGITRLNMYAGLSGSYFIRDSAEDSLDLPRGRYEIPLMIQDRLINADGSLLYPVSDNSDPEVPAFWVPEFFGDTVLVNGKVWPFLEVEPRKYRFRILNSSNARFYHLTLNDSRSDGHRLAGAAPQFIVIGTDGGFLPAPIRVSEVTIAPSERFDIVIDFSGAEGKFFLLSNDAKAPFPDGDDVIPADVMLFKVTARQQGRDSGPVPSRLPAADPIDLRAASRVRDLVLIENASAQDNPIEGLISAHWMDAVTETPRAGGTEVWRIINTTGDAHPIHVHLVQFNILDRQPFDVDQYPDRLVFTGPRVAPPADERGAAKDVVKSFPGEVTRIVSKFDLPSGTRVSRGQKVRYVLHCHILEHEDNDMMRPYDVVG
jgi:spore coat protein A